MEDWSHHSNPHTNNPLTPENYRAWIKLQEETYKTKDINLSKLITSLSLKLSHPLTKKETEDITSHVEPYSAIPLLEEVRNFYFQNNPINSVLLYLGAGVDFEHSSLFFPSTSVFVDKNEEYNLIHKSMSTYFKKIGYKTETTQKKNHNILTLTKEGLEKEFIFIKEDINNKDKIKEILSQNNIYSVDFLIQKKASGHPQSALNCLDLLSKAGLLLYSDMQVYKSIPGMTQLWHGELYSYRLQDDGDIDIYPAKLFRKE